MNPQYLLSLPERMIRSLGALSGGLLREIGDVVLPASLRRTTLYRTMVDVALRFLIEEVGQVEGVYPSEGELAGNFLLKRSASSPSTPPPSGSWPPWPTSPAAAANSSRRFPRPSKKKDCSKPAPASR